MFQPLDYYRLAGELHYNHSKIFPEASARSSVSRAYYAAFLAAREKSGVGKDVAEVHRKVIEHFKNRKPALYLRLKDLRKKRNDADYDLHIDFSKKNSGDSLSLSKEILKELGYLKGE